MKKMNFNKRNLKYGGFSVLLTAVIVAAVILVNVAVTSLGSTFSWYSDLTGSSMYSVSEAFDRLLAKDGGFYEEPPHLPVFEVLDFLRGIGAVSVLAHPFLSFKSEEEMRKFLPEAKAHGLGAMETVYSTYTEEEAERARSIAREFGLLSSGGSDFHGEAKPDINLGTGKGNLAVPTELLDALRKEAK